MGTVAQDRRGRNQKARKKMFGFLLLSLPGLLTAAPASLTSKHVVKAPSPIYTPPVYNEHTGQGINHGYGQGLGFGHGHGAAYGQAYANGAHAAPIKPGHVFTGYPAYTQGHHTGHQVGHHVGHQVGHHVWAPGWAQCWPVHRRPPALPCWRAVPSAACLPCYPVPRRSLPWSWTQDCKCL